MRREWIEMSEPSDLILIIPTVSLHAEGVD